jgi:outer membrane protein OmpA-like peptidoglycan-associated protein
MRRTCRSRAALWALCLALGALSMAACKKKNEGHEDPRKVAAKQSLEEIKGHLGEVQKAATDVRARFNALPEDLPGLEAVRSKLFAIEEVLGVENARVRWLSGELNAAFAAKNNQQIQKISETISSSVEGSKKLEKPVVELSHQLLPFERTVARFRALVASGEIFTRVLPTGYQIQAANDGVEKQLIDFVDDPKKKVDRNTWFVFDRISFSGPGAQLDLEQSKEQLENVAAILKAYPRLKLEIGGYTDNTLPAATSKKLSTAGANAVKEMLVGLGVAGPRLVAEGHGPAQPLCAANDTEECKAKNRRIAARVTAK